MLSKSAIKQRISHKNGEKLSTFAVITPFERVNEFEIKSR